MKKNRKQLNKEKKNLPREKERILDRNLFLKKEVSGDVSPLRIDGTGNITRLINKKGSVPPTETKMYKCEIEKSVPQFVRSLVDKIGLGEMIRVPIRTNGLTGSGNYKRCHPNVIGLVKRFGGNQLQGYIIERGYDERVGDIVSFSHHSVWITPEGKCVDVTNNYEDEDRKLYTDDSIIRKGYKEYILFVPFGLGMTVELGVGVTDIFITKRWKKVSVYLRSPNEDEDNFVTLNKRDLDKFQKKNGFIDTDHHKEGTIPPEVVKQFVELGGFSQKSLGSGKSWNELKTEIVW